MMIDKLDAQSPNHESSAPDAEENRAQDSEVTEGAPQTPPLENARDDRLSLGSQTTPAKDHEGHNLPGKHDADEADAVDRLQAGSEKQQQPGTDIKDSDCAQADLKSCSVDRK